MAISAEQVLIFREALEKARKDLQIADDEKDRLFNEELALKKELWQLQRLIDALEILLGEKTEVEVFKRNKKLRSAAL